MVGILPGSEHPDEAVLYMAHWDHLGKHDSEQTPDGKADVIYNGAVDNGTGVAGILEIAGKFAGAPTPPKRSVVFVAVTLEESGLLGSQYYVAHPVVPLDKTVAVINLDALSPIGKEPRHHRGRHGRLGTRGHPQADRAAGRHDHARRIAAGSGFVLPFRPLQLRQGRGAGAVRGQRRGPDRRRHRRGRAASKDYNDHRYHKPGDQYDAATWKLDGILAVLNSVYGVGEQLANDDAWPNWYKTNPFRAARDKMMAAKTAAPMRSAQCFPPLVGEDARLRAQGAREQRNWPEGPRAPWMARVMARQGHRMSTSPGAASHHPGLSACMPTGVRHTRGLRRSVAKSPSPHKGEKEMHRKFG